MVCERSAIGVEVGTGASIQVSIGFRPVGVRLYNTTGCCEMWWDTSMSDGYGYKETGMVTSGGITPSDDDDTFMGFTIGADTDINQIGESISYIAWG